ncbi:MAG: glycosyl transferase family 1 [Verrucomicrobiaceae bacterium]|nr:glycosyl transferase family 1 [Verrucomicrobiaceae bacterium]
MRVLHVIPSVAPCRGGPSTAVLAMVRALTAQGVQADIVTTNDNGSGVLPVSTGSLLNYQGCHVCFLPRWSPGVAALREFQYAQGFDSWLRSALRGYDGLHVHAVFSYLPTRAMMIARKAGKPYMSRPLGQLDAWSLQQKALKKRLYYGLVEKTNLAHAAAVHCTSEMEAANVRQLLPQARVEIIPHGIEPPAEIAGARSRLRQAQGLSENAKVLLFLSRWHAKKNIPMLLEALAGMKDENWTLILAGSADDGYETVVRQAIRDHGLQERVRCPGHVQGEQKALLLQGADVFVLPSSAENFGIAVAEALVNGMPAVVTWGVDLAPVVVELEGGYACDANAVALRAGMLQALKRPDDRMRLRLAARARFDWKMPASKLSALYAEVFSTNDY